MLLASCGGDGDESRGGKATTSGAPPAKVTTIVIRDSKFEPATLTARVGDTITVKNDDAMAHTATAQDRSFDTGPLKPGQSTTIRLTREGTTKYECAVHPYIQGSIVVER